MKELSHSLKLVLWLSVPRAGHFFCYDAQSFSHEVLLLVERRVVHPPAYVPTRRTGPSLCEGAGPAWLLGGHYSHASQRPGTTTGPRLAAGVRMAVGAKLSVFYE